MSRKRRKRPSEGRGTFKRPRLELERPPVEGVGKTSFPDSGTFV